MSNSTQQTQIGRQLGRWLSNSGWRIVSDAHEMMTLREDSSGQEVLLSLSDSAIDAEAINNAAIHTLRRLRNMSSAQLLSISSALSEASIIVTGLLDRAPLLESNRITQAVEDTVLAAAWSERVGPRASLRGPRPPEVNELLRTITVGHTLPGSYIIPITLGEPTEQQASASAKEQPMPIATETLAARTLRRMVRAASAAVAASLERRAGAEISVFSNTVGEGVTSNFCSALSRAGIAARGNWRLEVNLPQTDLQFPEEIMAGAIAQELDEGSKYLLQTDDNKLVEIVGPVEHLDRPDDELAGTIGIRFDNRLYYVDLSQDKYERAVEAHKNKQILAVAGRARRYGRRTHIEDVRYVRTLSQSLGI